MRIFIKKQDKTNPPPNDDDDLPLLPSTLKTYYQSECSMAEWEEYVPDILSSPSARRFKFWAKGTKINLARAELQSLELSQLQAKFDEQIKKKPKSQKSISKSGSPNIAALQEKIRVKELKGEGGKVKESLQSTF